MTESNPLPADPLHGQPHEIVERDGVRYTLLGTAHVSRASVEAVLARAIDAGAGDPDQLDQVQWALLDNAVVYGGRTAVDVAVPLIPAVIGGLTGQDAVIDFPQQGRPEDLRFAGNAHRFQKTQGGCPQ